MKDEREEFVFDSNFESGNLDFVGKVSENEYDMIMRLDSNSRSHQQWFYFSIDCKDVRRRSTKGETIKINILNFTKPNTLYNQVRIKRQSELIFIGYETCGMVKTEMCNWGHRMAQSWPKYSVQIQQT